MSVIGDGLAGRDLLGVEGGELKDMRPDNVRSVDRGL